MTRKKKKSATAFAGPALAGLFLFSAFYPGGAAAYSPAGYPGAVWGGISRGPGTEGSGTQGWARQGVRWASFGGKLNLDTYAAYNWRVRTENKTYYNTYGPSLIAELGAGPFSFGAEYGWLRYPEQSANIKYFSLFAGWYDTRDISKWTGLPYLGSHAPLALPFSSWGKFSYDLQGAEGSGSQGWVKQGVDWFYFGRGLKFNTYAAYNWRVRTKNKQYYNVHGPSLGAVFSYKYFNLGAEYSRARFTQLGRTDKTFNIFFNWFYGWNLKRK